MAKLTVDFNKGIMPPARIGTLQLKPTTNGVLSYAQNIDLDNDEYGAGLVVPGPALTTITNNSELTGVLFAKALFTSDTAIGFEYIVLAEGLLGATNKLRIVSGVKNGGTPQISTTNATVLHNDAAGDDTGHTGIVINDITEYRDAGGNTRIILVGRDATDEFLMKATISSGGGIIGTFSQISTVSTRDGHRMKLFVGDDNKVYVSRGVTPAALLSVDADLTTVTTSKFTMPQGKAVTAMGKYGQSAAIAYSSAEDGDFATRKAAATSGVILWDYVSAQAFIKDIPVPTNHISVVINDPSGATLLFGGLDQGKTTLFELNGYGVSPLVSYIGDMPYSRHSVTFDSQGRILWLTVDGQLMRYNKSIAKLEHLSTVSVTAGYGGILSKLLGGTGNDFLLAGGTDASPDTFICKRVIFGSYVGDDDAGSDGITTPLAVSGQRVVPHNSAISAITLFLSRPLQTGEKIILRTYENGSTTANSYMTMEYVSDGAVSAKREVLTRPDLNNFALGIVYKQADGATTAPAVITAEVEIDTQY